MVSVTESPTMGTGSIKSAEQKFIADLSRIYDAEHRFLEGLRQTEQKVSNNQLKSIVQLHVQQTQEQIQSLEQVFGALGQQPQRITCLTAEGLIREGETILQEIGNNPVLQDCAIADKENKTEHMEIASYGGLIKAAVQTGQREIVNLLMKNSLQEEKAAKGYEMCLLELSKQAMSS